MNFAVILSKIAGREGDKPAVVESGMTTSYRQLWCGIEESSRRLLNAGVRPGDRVAIALPNGAAFVQNFFATLLLQAIGVPVRHEYARHEVGHIVANAQPRALVSDAAWMRARPWLAELLPPDMAVVNVDEATQSNAGARTPPPTGSSRSALISYAYTGAGEPLGAEHSHRSCVLAGIAYVRHLRIRRDDRILFTLPMPNAFTLAGCVFAPLLRGATLVIEHDFAPKVLLAAIERHRVSIVTGVPDIFRLLAARYRPSRFDLGTLRLMITGGAYMPAEDHLKIEEKIGVPLVQGYGLTECFPVLCNPPDERNRPGSLGVAGRDVRLKIVDEGGRDLGAGQTGEIVVSCPFAMKGYFRRAGRTAQVFDGTWLRTGDLGYTDEQGYVYFDRMKKSLYNLHGNKVDPGEVRSVLLSHPDVLEAEVVCEGDSLYNGSAPKVRARVRLRAGAVAEPKAIRQFCRDHMASYKAPTFVDVLSAEKD